MSAHRLLASSGGDAEGMDLLIPEPSEIFWSLLIFVIIAVAFWRFFLPKFTAILDERTAKIEGGIAKAEEAQAQADAALAEYTQQLADARAEASKIREDARAEGTVILEDIKRSAREEAQRITEAAQRQMETERSHAIATLRSDVGSLATELASRIVGEALANEVRQSNVIDRFLDEIEENAGAQGIGAGDGQK